MIPPAVCLDVIPFTCTVAAPQSDEKDLCLFEIFWLHLPQYQKGGVQQLLLITPSCLMVYH